MPEEVNRIITDHLSRYLFCPNENAKSNLIKEGIQEDNIYIVGDVMCDMLNLIKDKITSKVDYEYYFATIHRPYNTDDKSRMIQILESLEKLEHQIVFPIHPRTRNLLKSYHVDLSQFKNINFIEPIGYLDSLSYQKFSDGVITDSGGMQKEAYMLRKKCITIRSETEWIETLIGGWNTLVFDDLGRISSILKTPSESYKENLYGDGFSSNSIVKILENNG
jgi:UDP-GlcNAc3NAcA epimerase